MICVPRLGQPIGSTATCSSGPPVWPQRGPRDAGAADWNGPPESLSVFLVFCFVLGGWCFYSSSFFGVGDWSLHSVVLFGWLPAIFPRSFLVARLLRGRREPRAPRGVAREVRQVRQDGVRAQVRRVGGRRGQPTGAPMGPLVHFAKGW